MTHEESAFTARLTRVIQNAGGVSPVAKVCGVTTQAVYGWMNGSTPLRSSLVRLCNALGVSIRWMDTGEGEAENPHAAHDHPKHAMHEDTPGTKENNDLARTLSELILGFEELPPAYEKIALQQIEEHFAEFRRRATLRADVRHPHNQRNYPQSNHKKRKP